MCGERLIAPEILNHPLPNLIGWFSILNCNPMDEREWNLQLTGGPSKSVKINLHWIRHPCGLYMQTRLLVENVPRSQARPSERVI